jgi:hypothetical protein
MIKRSMSKIKDIIDLGVEIRVVVFLLLDLVGVTNVEVDQAKDDQDEHIHNSVKD